MIVLDVNVHLAALRADHAHHVPAQSWLTATLEAGTGILVPDFIWVGFLRLVTNAHIFEVPSTPAEAFEFVDAVCGGPSYVGIPGLAEGISVFREVVLGSDCLRSHLNGHDLWACISPHGVLRSRGRSSDSAAASATRSRRRSHSLLSIDKSVPCGPAPSNENEGDPTRIDQKVSWDAVAGPISFVFVRP